MASKSNATFKNMNAEKVVADLRERIDKPEHMLGRALLQPYCNTNSGSRKLMHSTHLEQRLPLLHPEVPIIQTGYENEFGRYSSSFYKANDEYIVLKKIEKFPMNPNHQYYLIVQNTRTSELDIIERKQYEYNTETYGFLYNNSYLDRLEPVDMTSKNLNSHNIIHRDDVYKKSMAFDDYNNRQDGVNLLTGYIATAQNTEDSVIISESAAKKLASPLIKPVTIIINENDILLDIYSDGTTYKSFPDIGEEVKDNLLTVVRREKKEESLFTQSYNRLKEPMINDDKFIVGGKVVDIDVYCNNPETINSSIYNTQVSKYYNNHIRYLKELVDTVKLIKANDPNVSLSYELDKLVFNSERELEGTQFINERPFTGTILKITVLEENEIKVGDKVSDRYGGKGVISFIKPDNEMPIIEDTGESVEILFNSCTCVGRLNPGQMFETSTTFIGRKLIDFILLEVLDPDQSIDLVREYMELAGTQMNECLEDMLDPNNPEELKEEYLQSIVNDKGIMLSLEPISNSMTIDLLAKMYDEFNWAKQYQMIMPRKNSNGDFIYTRSRRPMVIGTKYIYRLKQYGEDKFSATALSATNIRNLNTRSKANKQYKTPYTRTPIRVGDMESANLLHMGNSLSVAVLLMYSSSPHARRSIQVLYTGDPFDVNIKLDNKAKNRNVEIINTRLKTCGYKLSFKKIPIKKECPVVRFRRDIVIKVHCPVIKVRKDIVTKIKKAKKE